MEFIQLIHKNRKILLVAFSVWIFILIATYISMNMMKEIPSHAIFKPNRLNWFDIFCHNSMLAILYICLGYLSFGLISTCLFIYNVYLTSYATYFVYAKTGSWKISIGVIFTHGVIEIIAMTLCFLLSTTSFRWLINRMYQREIFYISTLKEKGRLVLFMFALYLVAAIIESVISPQFFTE